MIECQIDIKTLISLKLSFEAYFVLYCLYKKNNKLMLAYIVNCKKVNTEIFKGLETNKYLTINYRKDDANIYFDNLTLTEKGKLIFVSMSDDQFIEASLGDNMTKPFEDFRNNYPKTIKKNGKTIRQLHSNLKRCKVLYKTIIENEISHEDLCKCARLYIKEKRDSNSEEYIQMLQTWLHERNYEAYLNEKEQIEGSGGFVDDI